jgi:hypothetical protein
MAYNVPAVCSGCLRRFGGPDKEMRSISRADKLWVKAGVGVRPQADRLASRNPGTAGAAFKDEQRFPVVDVGTDLIPRLLF